MVTLQLQEAEKKSFIPHFVADSLPIPKNLLFPLSLFIKTQKLAGDLRSTENNKYETHGVYCHQPELISVNFLLCLLSSFVVFVLRNITFGGGSKDETTFFF